MDASHHTADHSQTGPADLHQKNMARMPGIKHVNCTGGEEVQQDAAAHLDHGEHDTWLQVTVLLVTVEQGLHSCMRKTWAHDFGIRYMNVAGGEEV